MLRLTMNLAKSRCAAILFSLQIDEMVIAIENSHTMCHRDFDKSYTF